MSQQRLGLTKDDRRIISEIARFQRGIAVEGVKYDDGVPIVLITLGLYPWPLDLHDRLGDMRMTGYLKRDNSSAHFVPLLPPLPSPQTLSIRRQDGKAAEAVVRYEPPWLIADVSIGGERIRQPWQWRTDYPLEYWSLTPDKGWPVAEKINGRPPAWQRLELREGAGSDIAFLDRKPIPLSGCNDLGFLRILQDAEGTPVAAKTITLALQQRADVIYDHLPTAIQRIVSRPGKGGKGYLML